MNFHVEKRKVMHLGKNNLNYTRTDLGSEFAVMTQERDLDVFGGSMDPDVLAFLVRFQML